MDLSKIIRREVITQRAYHTPEVLCPLKLDANESPFPLPANLRQELFDRLNAISLHRYPAAGAPALNRKIAAALGVHPDMVMTGNGSDELIAILCAATGGPGAVTLMPSPTFAMYRISARNYGHQTLEVPLTADRFELDREAMSRQLREYKPNLTFISYPNNPTGNCFRRELIEEIIRESSGLVVVDEAYYHFSGQTFLPLLSQYDNLVILRSFSKVGLAAFRIGLMVASGSVIHELNKVRLPYNLNAFSQAAAEFFLDHEPDFIRQTEEIIRLKSDLYEKLAAIPRITTYPSDANFIFFRCIIDADRIYVKLLEKGIMIRNFHSPGILENCMRVTVGTGEQNDFFVETLKDAAAQWGA